MIDSENKSDVDCDDISNRIKGGGDCCCLDSDHFERYDVGFDSSDDDYEARLLDQVVRVFLNAAAVRGCCRPIPALVGDAQPLDLAKLFWVVRERGGFDMVNGFWSFVAKELGLNTQLAASIKLVYFKYLYDLERWMRRNCRDETSGNLKYPSGGSFGFLSPDVERKFKSLLSLGYAERRKDDGLTSSEHQKIEKNIVGLSDNRDVPRASNGIEMSTDDVKSFADNEKICYTHDAQGIVNLDPKTAEKEFNFRKRKREPLSEMLNWLILVAKCPDDTSVGKIPPVSKWKDHGRKELCIQAIRAKNVLLPKRRDDSRPVQSLLQINQKMNPTMYEDTHFFGEESAERLRCREQLPAVKPCFSSRASCSTSQTKPINHSKVESERDLKEQECATGYLSGANPVSASSGIENNKKHIPVGPRFQADVPKWIETVYESDSKWLGTRTWPLECGKHNVGTTPDPIGKGRPDTCGCQYPGSTGCIGFHIAERRMKLKVELGSVFFIWKFDRMGEEVSLRWTPEEEKSFKDMVKFKDWNDVHKHLPRKTREDLVSYYFNVFIARRRRYQNRVTPKDIDSDDDNPDLGSLSNGCGNEVLEIPGDNILSCLENKQCTDFT